MSKIDELIDALGSFRAGRRAEAALRLKQLGAEAVEPLVRRLALESRRRRYNWAASYFLISISVLFYIWLAPKLVSPANWPLLLAYLPITLLVMRLNAWSRLQINAARLLTQIDDVRAVGPLADALESRDLWVVSSTRAHAAAALVRLLPRLTEDDAELLNARQRECLYRALDHAGMFDADLTSAVIRAMGVIGNESAVRPLRRLIDNRYFVGRHSEMEGEAERALSAIRRRESNIHAPEILLRAVDGADEPEVLLRSVATGSDEDPASLLRVESR